MKIVESSYVLFDEFTQHVFDKLPEPFMKYREPLRDEYAPGIIDDLYEVWYYYMNNPVMRYVNNYYEYKKYDPRLFEKNMKKAVNYLCKLIDERVTKSTREMMAELSDISEDEKVVDVNFNRYHIYYIWRTEPGCCKICAGYDGRIIELPYRFQTHWNCRCYLEQVIDILDETGEVIETKSKIL